MIKLTDDQKEILSRYTKDFSVITKIGHHEYTHLDADKSSKLLEDYHVIWFPEDRGNMYLVPK